MKYFDVRRLAIKLLGGKCCDGTSCGGGTNDIDILTIDHIHGDGNVHAFPGERAKELLEAIENDTLKVRFQLFCWNCHYKKTLRQKDYRHKSARPEQNNRFIPPPLLKLMINAEV